MLVRPERKRWFVLAAGVLMLMCLGTAQAWSVYVKPIAAAWDVGTVVLLAIPAVAAGNAAGRIFWGHMLDRIGTRRAMRGAQFSMLFGMSAIIFASGHPLLFLIAAMAIGFSYGSNFSIYPGTIARIYGPHVLGSVYPFVMLAQGFSSSGPATAGFLNDLTGSYLAGLCVGLGVALVGLVISIVLHRGVGTSDETQAPSSVS